jgi:5-(carboxyamino)imidazole ribonucleotide synthase
VGVIGGGQLGLMLGQAGQPLGVTCTFLEPGPEPCAKAVGRVVRAPYDDPAGLDALAAESDVVTYEFENVPASAVEHLARRGIQVHPASAALAVAQDRLAEKAFFEAHGVGCAPHVAVSSVRELEEGLERLGAPAILKTRRLGYDGKGQVWLDDRAGAAAAYAGVGGVPCVLEQVVPFDRELSVLAVRGRDGEVRTWPLVENNHAGGILRWSLAPAPDLPGGIQEQADALAARLLGDLGYVGVLAVELFLVGDTLLANEMAPRVHNSGHWSIEGALTSQFENHLRAVLGLPLGACDVPLPCGCVNLLGRVPPLGALLAIPGVRVHLYGKSERPGRKLGHATVRGHDAAEVHERLDAVRALSA